MKRLMDGLDDLAGLDIVMTRKHPAPATPRSGGLLVLLQAFFRQVWASRQLPTT